MREICSVCGSGELDCIDDSTHTYRCRSCGEKFDLKERPPVNTVIKKIVVEKPAKKEGLTPAEIYKKVIGGIVELKCRFGDEVMSGTAFYISSDGYLITNCHMVVDSESGKPKLCEGVVAVSEFLDDEINLELVYIDPKNDLALLKDNRKGCAALKFAAAVPEIGSSVVAIGNSKGQGLSIVNGIISDLNRTHLGHDAFLFNALVEKGCSGGPVLDSNGEVCGVTVGGRVDANGMKYAIPLETVKKFIFAAEDEKGIKIELVK